jgi:glycosyltransferase involved in cell wall biosynthesis
MDLNSVTPLILTYNEQANIDLALKGLAWAQQVVVVDSDSNDATQEIANRYTNVKFIRRTFDNHAAQWNFGLAQIETPWVLTLDADYRCPDALADEIRSLNGDCDAYLAAFAYCVSGKPLRSTLYPPRAVLFRPQRCNYVQEGHTQILVHEPARTRRLRTKLLHDDRKPLSQWLEAQTKYEELEAKKLFETPLSQLGWKGRLRRWHIVIPFLTFFYCLFVKRLILDGRAGLYFTLQRVYVELLISLNLLNRKMRKDPHRAKQPEPKAIPAATYELSHPGN